MEKNALFFFFVICSMVIVRNLHLVSGLVAISNELHLAK
jgi:hypothetical protein